MTKRDRHECYKIALVHITTNRDRCCCNALRHAYHLATGLYYISMYEFTEFIELKPENANLTNFWWNANDKQSRIEALEQCIEQTKP